MTFPLTTRLIGFALALGLLAGVPSAKAQQIDTPAREAVLMDYETGAVLFEKNGHEATQPSSMSKLMTLAMLFEQLKDGRVKLSDKFTVSEHAWKTGGAGTDGSTMFAELGSSIGVEDLIRGIVIQSGNDACIIVAEALAGTEEAFAELMNERAKQLGMKESHFVNATGLPDPAHVMSAYDIALLSRHIIRDLSEYYHYFSETEFEWNGIKQQNRNPLLFFNMGADGLKTGHTQVAGFGLASSAVRNGQRLVLVVNGLDSIKARGEESRRLLELGFREFKTYDLLAAGTVVDKAEVWNGSQSVVPLVVKMPVRTMMRRSARPGLKVAVRYDGPIVAPISEGQQVGTLNVTAPGAVPLTVPVYAAQSVSKKGPIGQIGAAIVHLLQGGATDPTAVATSTVTPAAATEPAPPAAPAAP